ncbi:MAG: hypothetical protein MK236_08915 [Pedosphaera sp.]|nr:hypothetical protein [Pedosphaera sp.]
MKSTLIALLTLGLCLPLLAQNKPKPDVVKRNVEWQKEEMCQFVFFAVLEGLYRDGIQNEIVDAIIGEKIVKKENKVKTHFVFRCKLCHATYEAFRTYRNRPAFMQTKGASTFGKGADLALLKQLGSKDARTRIYSMGALVRPWIMHRIKETRKTAVEKTAMKKQFEKYAQEGADLLKTHKRAKDGFYLDWSFYGSCQACEAAKDLGKAGF